MKCTTQVNIAKTQIMSFQKSLYAMQHNVEIKHTYIIVMQELSMSTIDKICKHTHVFNHHHINLSFDYQNDSSTGSMENFRLG